jgi:hypothetical protein
VPFFVDAFQIQHHKTNDLNMAVSSKMWHNVDRFILASRGSVLMRVVTLLMFGFIALNPVGALAETMKPTLNTFGATGLIDMPTAEQQPDGELTSTISYFGGIQRYTVSFQILPRLSGSFRYSIIPNFNTVGSGKQFDRSFDLRYQILEESKYLPAVTVGFQDFIGTGIYSGEYVVATKRLHPKFKATAGIGWGRFSSTRRVVNAGVGGNISAGDWFSGSPSFFAGVEWKTPVEGLNFKIEYSSDRYPRETITRSVFQRKHQVNFGLDYTVNDTTHLSAYYLYGSEFGLQLSFALNPKHSAFPSGTETAGLPVLTRPDRGGASYDTQWATANAGSQALQDPAKLVLEASNLTVEALKVDATHAKVYVRNPTFHSTAQAVGRAARAMTRILPHSVENIEIISMENGLPVISTTFQRSDLERLEHVADGSEKLYPRTQIAAVRRVDREAVYAEGLYPNFTWSLKPYLRASFFDPDTPIRADTGLRLRGRLDVSRGLSFSGSIIKPLLGNIDESNRVNNSVLPRVRSDATQYFAQGDPALERLTADYVFKLSPEVYGRLSAGYFETMFGGVSAEVLWKPVGRKFALGAELNYVKQRDFDQRLGFRDYSVTTGHVSAYLDIGHGFEGQLDLGRYLAGDWGGTVSVNRTFGNGWKVGGFFTLTDVPFSDFGEGSFDKGITASIPLATLFGQPSRNTADIVIRPLSRDGGARLRINNRLYDSVENYDRPSIKAGFGRVWR